MKLLVISFIFLAVSVVVPKAGAQSCKSADQTSAVVTSEIRQIVTTSNRVRDSLQLPLVSASQVVLVTDTLICSRVREALDSMIVATTPDAINLGPRPIYTIRIGTYYAAINPGSQFSEFLPVFFFNALFAYLSVLAL